MKTKMVSVLATLVLLGGCSGTGESTEAESGASPTPTSASPTPTPSPTPSPSPSPVVVSLQTTCELLFNAGDRSVAQRAISFVQKQNYSQAKDLSRAQDLAEDLEGISVRAQPEFRPYLDAMLATARDLEDQLTTGQGREMDLQDFRAAGLELVGLCEDHIR